MAIALGDLAGEHRAGRAVDVPDRAFDRDRRAVLERAPRLLDEAAVEDVVDRVVLLLAVPDGDAFRRVRLVEQAREVEALGLPVRDRLGLVEHLHLPDHLVERAVAERGHDLAHLLGDEEEVVDDVLRACR